MARRLQAMGQPNYARGSEVATHAHMLERPLGWRRPCTVFVNSMGDLFHEEVPDEFIERVFATMHAASRHQFQVLTKRSGRLAELAPDLPWGANVWAGVSVESVEWVHRIDDLRGVPAAVRFLSVEPLLGALPDLDLSCVDWVIVGGESGPRARPVQESWVRDVRDQCVRADAPFFFKQWGGTRKRAGGRELDHRDWDDMPVSDPCRKAG